MQVTGHSGFGIKKRYWFGGRSRPPFMEPGVPLGVPLGVPPPHDGYKGHLRRSSSFPLKDDAGYIGYLSDEGGSGAGDGDIMSVVHRRRRELLGPDISFTMCCLLMVMVMMVVMMVMWWFRWGFRPPATGNNVLGVPPPNGGNYVR